MNKQGKLISKELRKKINKKAYYLSRLKYETYKQILLHRAQVMIDQGLDVDVEKLSIDDIKIN